jgi:hypothetical protein
MVHDQVSVDRCITDINGASTSQPTTRVTSFTRYFTDNWAFESFSMAFGIVLIILMYVLVSHFEGKSVPTFGSVLNTDVTLNFAVSLLLSLAIPALMLPVAQCVSQLKWIWFSRTSRPLDHFETFDGASRGSLGGAYFLWKMRARYVPSSLLSVMFKFS